MSFEACQLLLRRALPSVQGGHLGFCLGNTNAKTLAKVPPEPAGLSGP